MATENNTFTAQYTDPNEDAIVWLNWSGGHDWAAAHLEDTECREFTGATLARVVPSTVADATAGKSYLAAVAVEHRIGFRA